MEYEGGQYNDYSGGGNGSTNFYGGDTNSGQYADAGNMYGSQETYGSQGHGSQEGSKMSLADGKSDGVMPLTIRQMTEAPRENNFAVVDGVHVHQCTVVGLVTSVRQLQGALEFTIDDGTGSCDLNYWEESSGSMPSNSAALPGTGGKGISGDLREGIYVRAVGNLTSFAEKPVVEVISAQPITDHNELTFHFLNVIRTHLHNTQGSLESKLPSANAAAAVGGAGQAFGGAGVHTSNVAIQNNVYADPGNSVPDIGADIADPVARVVLHAINIATQQNSTTGISMSDLLNQLSNHSEQQVRDGLRLLQSEGHVYDTVDDQHFKSALS
jgi:replication factor A2